MDTTFAAATITSLFESVATDVDFDNLADAREWLLGDTNPLRGAAAASEVSHAIGQAFSDAALAAALPALVDAHAAAVAAYAASPTAANGDALDTALDVLTVVRIELRLREGSSLLRELGY